MDKFPLPRWVKAAVWVFVLGNVPLWAFGFWRFRSILVSGWSEYWRANARSGVRMFAANFYNAAVAQSQIAGSGGTPMRQIESYRAQIERMFS